MPGLFFVLVGAVMVVAILAWLVSDRRRTDALRSRFGREYGRTLEQPGSRPAAEEAHYRAVFAELLDLVGGDQAPLPAKAAAVGRPDRQVNSLAPPPDAVAAVRANAHAPGAINQPTSAGWHAWIPTP